ncbi:MAG TPA: hypothetical protein VMP03_03970 [Methylomirabilota bacterium]|nr:hypothetical protein [Methylomirabilota bacterium]
MTKSSLIAAAAAAFIGFGSLAASTAPAAADNVSFGFQFGGSHGSPAVGFGFSSHPRYEPYPAPAYRGYRHPHRPIYREAPRRVVEVCEPVWKTRRIHDHWGRLVKVVKVRDRECRIVYR